MTLAGEAPAFGAACADPELETNVARAIVGRHHFRLLDLPFAILGYARMRVALKAAGPYFVRLSAEGRRAEQRPVRID